MHKNNIFSQALEYARLGYEVFPVAPRDKKPLTKNGCNDATTDIEQIKKWIKQYPDANIGIKAGKEILIIDVDNKDGKNGTADMQAIVEELGILPKRPFVKTPTGGFHLYFKHPDVGVKGVACVKYEGRETGIDIRVGNQYIVAPPSIHPNGGCYEWIIPLVPINELPELPQAWIENFLPLRDSSSDGKKVKANFSKTTDQPHDVFPLKIEDEREQKAIKYLETCTKAVQGKGGRKTLFSVAVTLVRGFKLEPQRATDIAWEYYNFYYIPFWTDSEKKEFDRMFSDAANYKCDKQDGWMIDTIKLDDATNASPIAWEPFPIDCFPSVLRDFCLAVARSTNTDPAYTVASVLSIVASAVGANFRVQAKDDWSAPAIIWTLVIADSGSGKSPALRFAIKVLTKIQKKFNVMYENETKEYDKKKQEYEGELAIWKMARKKGNKSAGQPDKPEPPKKRYCLVSDITTEALISILADNPFGLCASYNEAAILFGGLDAYRSGGNKDEGFFNDIFDGGYVQVNRKTGAQDTTAEHTHCSINGGIQPNSFKAILKKNPQFFFSGFFARFLLCKPPDAPRYFNEESVPKEIEAAYTQTIETLFFWRNKIEASPDNPCVVKLTGEAKGLFADYYNALADDRSSLPSGAMKASLSKLCGYVPRIALTLHVANYASKCPVGECPRSIPDIDAETMRAAISLVEWFRRESQRVLQIVSPTEAVEGDKEVVAILKHLANRSETTARTVTQNLRGFRRDMEGAEKKLDDMVGSGLLIVEKRKADNGVIVKHYSLRSNNAANANAVPMEGGENGVGIGGVDATVEVIDKHADSFPENDTFDCFIGEDADDGNGYIPTGVPTFFGKDAATF